MARILHSTRRCAAYAWAFPTTAVGLLAAALTLGTGGRAQIRRGAIEVYGGFARWFLERRIVGAWAMTLGHVVLGRDAPCLDFCREHELAHVRQVERWGLFFLPAYVIASAVVHLRGDHYYFDNPFERDARRACGDPEPVFTRPRDRRRRTKP